jgi:hypothetical protein
MTKRKDPPPEPREKSTPKSLRLRAGDVDVINDLAVALGSELSPADGTLCYRVAAAFLAGVLDVRPDLFAGVTMGDPRAMRRLGARLARGER